MLKNTGVKFALIFVISYFVLNGLSSIQLISETCNGLIRGVAGSLANVTMPQLKFNTKPDREGGVHNDNMMIVEFEWTQEKIDAVVAEARRTGRTDIEVPYRFISYLLFEFFWVPLLFLISLVIATPLNRTIKWKWGTIAFATMLLFLFSKYTMMTLFSVSKARIDVYELGHQTMKILHWMASAMTMGLSVIFAFFLWLVFVFPKSDLRMNIESWFDRKELN